jgi:hypothetical protein
MLTSPYLLAAAAAMRGNHGQRAGDCRGERRRWLQTWRVVMTVHIRRLASFLSPVARADAPASGNLPRVRADLAGLNTKLSGLIRRMQARNTSSGSPG